MSAFNVKIKFSHLNHRGLGRTCVVTAVQDVEAPLARISPDGENEPFLESPRRATFSLMKMRGPAYERDL